MFHLDIDQSKNLCNNIVQLNMLGIEFGYKFCMVVGMLNMNYLMDLYNMYLDIDSNSIYWLNSNKRYCLR